MNKEDIIKCFLDCKGKDNGFQLTLTNKDIDVIANEIEKLNNIINKAKEKSIYLQERYGYILDDLTFMLMQGSDK